MSNLFRSNSPATQSQAPSPDVALRVQTSVEGRPRPIVWGVTRLAGNLVWYGDFYAVSVSDNSGNQGGKGSGLFGGSASNTNANVTYQYYASVEIALAEGPLVSIGPVMWASKSRTTIQAVTGQDPRYALNQVARSVTGLTVGSTGFGVFLGSQVQLPWSYLTTAHPDQAFAYRLTGYIAGNVSLGASSELPNWSFEISAAFGYAAPNVIDADPTLVAADFLSNDRYGVPGWLGAYNGDWSYARDYVFASGLFVSLALVEQTSARTFLQDLFESLNLMPLWSETILKLVPLGDEVITANGHTYTPPSAPLYDLDDTDFLENQCSFGGTNADPVSGRQVPARNQNNVVKVEFTDRGNDYNSGSVQASDDGAILLYGERGSKGVKSWKWFHTQPAANTAAQLALGREQLANDYGFTIGPRFVLLEPGDIVAITDERLGLDRQWVRVAEVQENQDRSFNILADEYLEGTGAAPIYGDTTSAGGLPNYNEDPGALNAPLFFEPTDQLAGGLEVWVAVSGQDETIYGGYEAWVSYDGATYSRIPNSRIFGSARMGVLAAPLPAIALAPSGPTVDETNTLSVDLTESGADLESGSLQDALNFNTACYVGGEIISYQNAVLTGANTFDLTYLLRAAFGTETSDVDHPAGTDFVRLDDKILRVPFDQSRIGSTIYLKLLPFNIWGVTTKTLADVGAYTYVLTGAALASPLPNVGGLRTVFEDRFRKIWWNEITDFRNGIRYVVRKGPSWEGGLEIGTVAHPPIVAFGADTYWVRAVCQPVADLIVYSDMPSSITVAGNMLTQNVVLNYDYQALGWPGIYTNVGKEGTDPTAVLRLTGPGNILDDTDVLDTPDVLDSGPLSLEGTYEIEAEAYTLNVGYVADCYVNVTWGVAGLPVGTDVLTDPDILNNPDILNAAAAQFIEIWVEVRTAMTGQNDVYAPADIYAVPDVYFTGIDWTAWQRYVPGVYRAQWIEFQVKFDTIDPTIIAYLTSMLAEITIPARIDHYIGVAVGAVGNTTIIFEPDDAIAAKPFNGGPLVGGSFNHPLPAVSMDWSGSAGVNFIIDSLTLSQLVFHCVNPAGTQVAVPSADIYVEGY